MKYIGSIDKTENDKFYLVYFPFTLARMDNGRQIHIIRKTTGGYMDGGIHCEEFCYFSSHRDDTKEYSCGGGRKQFYDAFKMAHFYELDEIEALTYVLTEVI